MSYQHTIEWWPIDKVIPYHQNPRIRTEQQIADISKSIEEFGWQNHINVDPDGIIVSGHGRRLGAMKLLQDGKLGKYSPTGEDHVPVKVIRDLTPEKIRAFRIADNKVAEGSGWDNDLLKLEMAELMALLPDHIDITGFSLENIEQLLGTATDESDGPPDEFKRADPSAPTEHQCPKCGYAWNGKQA